MSFQTSATPTDDKGARSRGTKPRRIKGKTRKRTNWKCLRRNSGLKFTKNIKKRKRKRRIKRRTIGIRR